MTARQAILVLNAGSSSLKFAVHTLGDDALRCQIRGQFSGLPEQARFQARDADGRSLIDSQPGTRDHEQALRHLLAWLAETLPDVSLVAAGHRVVHGGSRFTAPVRLDTAVRQSLDELIPLAPLHMPHNLAAIDILARLQPALPQVACFDTAFHHTLPLREQHYALPREWYDRGVRRYGFHGLSYEYIASVLPDHLGVDADRRIIVAHLGHGASLCALHHRRSVATTMGLTPLDGIPMATRPGSLDPGIPIYMMREAGLDVDAVDDVLNHHSGLLGLSGISGDMQTLLASPHPHAAEAVDHFVYHTHRAIASLAAVLGGLDALVFTAGIGENAPLIRERICREAAWLGIGIDTEANAANAIRISLPDSRVSVWRIPTDEETVIARHVHRLLIDPAIGEQP
ncbi:MAG TPA: acetate/propionate family kinase [Gammaproteobacteria bacterium]|nr:acetate/propionate family kinase [Gammaproteobacteria bacterium]